MGASNHRCAVGVSIKRVRLLTANRYVETMIQKERCSIDHFVSAFKDVIIN
jgi:hypothetical protein